MRTLILSLVITFSTAGGLVAMLASCANTQGNVRSAYMSIHNIQDNAVCNPNLDSECPIEDVF